MCQRSGSLIAVFYALAFHQLLTQKTAFQLCRLATSRHYLIFRIKNSQRLSSGQARSSPAETLPVFTGRPRVDHLSKRTTLRVLILNLQANQIRPQSTKRPAVRPSCLYEARAKLSPTLFRTRVNRRLNGRPHRPGSGSHSGRFTCRSR